MADQNSEPSSETTAIMHLVVELTDRLPTSWAFRVLAFAISNRMQRAERLPGGGASDEIIDLIRLWISDAYNACSEDERESTSWH